MLREDRSDKLTNSARGRLFISASGGCVVAMEHSNRLNGRAGAIRKWRTFFMGSSLVVPAFANDFCVEVHVMTVQ